MDSRMSKLGSSYGCASSSAAWIFGRSDGSATNSMRSSSTNSTSPGLPMNGSESPPGRNCPRPVSVKAQES